ncbi:hypothetical protein QFC20_004348 [Naganishia adeliensis]|uniref:Uncharacterized protein n=1 Tax=Naganishia adeliensis TaxID=92952 RepID=A0ACC2W1G0_9TREE|nr:hypothetical protein QFC20_004348 [Naganishia adeliensis]
MVLKPKPGYIYRFHRHQLGANEPKAQQSPHVSPGTPSTARMLDAEPVASAHYYPPTWESHPMLPPGTIDPAPRGSAGPSPLSRVDQQPTPQTPMSVRGSPRLAGGPTTAADGGGEDSFVDWVCCAKDKAERAAVPS